MSKLQTVLKARKYYSNWYNVPLLYLGLKKRAVARLRTGERFVCYRWDDFLTMDDVFIKLDYKELRDNLKQGTTLIDIGTYNADSAIYFAEDSRVKQVLAFEAFPWAYRFALENLKLNSIASKIKLYNKAVAGKAGTIRLPTSRSTTGAMLDEFDAPSSNGSADIECVTLDSITKGIDAPIAVKSDCEGTEYEIFRNADLSKVYAIELEFHNTMIGQHTELVEQFKARGFKVRIVKQNVINGGHHIETGIMFVIR